MSNETVRKSRVVSQVKILKETTAAYLKINLVSTNSIEEIGRKQKEP